MEDKGLQILNLPKGTILTKEKYEKIVDYIPLNPIATPERIKELKKIEGEKPMDLIFVIFFEKSKNERRYSANAYKSIVKQILTSDVFIPVCYGHQSVEAFSYEGRQIVGSVIGAFLDEARGVVYYRIIPDSSPQNADIRRWLRNQQLNALSIWGTIANSKMDKDGVEVIEDFTLRSIDLVPPLSEGQANYTMLIGEQVENKCAKNAEGGVKMSVQNNVGEQKISVNSFHNEDLLNEMKIRMTDGRLTLQRVVGDLSTCGIASGESLAQKTKEAESKNKEISDILQEAKKHGFNTIEELFKFVENVKNKEEKAKKEAEFKKNVEQVKEAKGLTKDGKPTGQMASIVDKWAHLSVGMSKDEIKTEIDKVCEDELFKRVIGESVGAPSTNFSNSNIAKENEDKIVFNI